MVLKGSPQAKHFGQLFAREAPYLSPVKIHNYKGRKIQKAHKMKKISIDELFHFNERVW